MPTKAPLLGKQSKYAFLIGLCICFSACSLKYKHRTKPRNFYTGFIVPFSGDTIEGKVKLKNDFKGKVWYIKEGSKKRQYIFPEDVRYMQITSLRFKNVLVSGRERLLEQIAYGTYNLYGYVRSVPDRGNVHYYYLELEEGKELTRINQSNYLEVLRLSVFQDPYIMEKVDSGVWNYDDMLQIFRVYNARNKK